MPTSFDRNEIRFYEATCISNASLSAKTQIIHGKSVAIGILLAKTEDKSLHDVESSPVTTMPDTHWIVRTEDNDEQSIPERMLRNITEEGSHENNSSSVADSDGDTSSKRRISPSKRSTKPTITKAKKTVAFASRKSAATTTTSNTSSKKTPDLFQEKIHTTRAATRSSGNAEGLFKGIEEIVLPPKPRPVPKAASSNNGNVIKITMLTGTLYMYRDGAKRRVQFVRSK